jgi:adenosyl cobinamide kinase/adenosyl cobinamide phosphate guanylyltransferase
MIFIIGGNSQGKLEFAKELLQVQDESITDGAVCEIAHSFQKPVLNHLHLLIKRLKEEGRDPHEFIRQGIACNPDITIVCDELSTGVIPVLREDRELQELVGRVQCLVAKSAEKGYRVYCAIPVLIKGDPHAR